MTSHYYQKNKSEEVNSRDDWEQQPIGINGRCRSTRTHFLADNSPYKDFNAPVLDLQVGVVGLAGDAVEVEQGGGQQELLKHPATGNYDNDLDNELGYNFQGCIKMLDKVTDLEDDLVRGNNVDSGLIRSNDLDDDNDGHHARGNDLDLSEQTCQTSTVIPDSQVRMLHKAFMKFKAKFH